MADLELVLGLRTDGKGQVVADVRQVKDETGGLSKSNDELGRSAKRAGKGMEDGARGTSIFMREADKARRTSGSFHDSLTRIARVGGIVAGVLGGISLGALAQDMAQTIFQTDLLQATLLTATGGLQALADQAFSAIEIFASRTPFALEQSIAAFIKMQNLGILPTEERLQGFGNTAAAMGRSLNQMIEAVADAATGEFERLKEFGIKASSEGDRVKFTFQGVTTEVGKNSEEIVQYLTNIGNTNFAGAMEAQMQRLPGLWSNLKDNIDGIWRDVGELGVRNMFGNWLSAGIQWTADIRAAIQSGWFDWFEASLDVQTARFSGWTDTTAEVWNGFMALFSAPDGSTFGRFMSFMTDAIADLPINLRTAAAIMLGETDKLVIGMSSGVQLFVNNAATGWENFKFTATSIFLSVEQAAAQMIEGVIQRFGGMVTQIGSTLDAINSTALGDSLVPDGALARIQATGEALANYSALSQGVAADIAEANAAHAETIGILEEERASIETLAEFQREAADEFIDQALAHRQEVLATRDAEVEAAEAAAEHARVTYEQNKALEQKGATLDEVAAQLKKETDAQAKATAEAEAFLDAVIPSRVALREYNENLETAAALLAAGTITQAEYNAAVAALGESAEKAGLSGAGLAQQWGLSIDSMRDATTSWFRQLLTDGQSTFSSLEDRFIQTLANMADAALNTAINIAIDASDATWLDAFTTEGTGFFTAQQPTSPPATSTPPYSDAQGATGTGDLAAGAGGASASSGGFLAAAGWAALAVGIFRTIDDLQNGLYEFGDVLSGDNLHQKYGDALGGLGSVLFPGEEYVDPLGIGDFVNDLLGVGSGGNNKARATFDLASGEFSAEGRGKNFDKKNLEAAEALGLAVVDFADLIGGSTFAGSISVGNKHGIRVDGKTFGSDQDAALLYAFNNVIDNSTNLSEKVKQVLSLDAPDAQTLQRNTVDALGLEQLFAVGDTVFDDVTGFTDTFTILAEQFRDEGQTFADVFAELDAGIAILGALGQSTEQTVDNLLSAQALVDQLGTDRAQAIGATVTAIGGGLRSQLADLKELERLTNRDIYETQVAGFRNMLEVFDGSLAATEAIAQATIARREAELALLAELDAVSASITGRIGNFREQIILDGLSEQGQYNRYRDQIADLGLDLETATSAAEIDRILSEIDRLSRAAYGLLDPAQQDARRPEWLEFLDEFDAKADARIAELEDDIVETSAQLDTDTQNAIWEKAGLAGENLNVAADSLTEASQQQVGAAEATRETNAALQATVRDLQVVVARMAETQRRGNLTNGAIA